jgi:hypothetical protein
MLTNSAGETSPPDLGKVENSRPPDPSGPRLVRSASLFDCSATRAFLGEAPVHWRSNLRLMLKEEAQLG